MKSLQHACIMVATLTALALPLPLAAQEIAKPQHPHQYHHYQIVDPGTFGGPSSHQSFGIVQGNLNDQGAFAPGAADTNVIDPLCYDNPPDCYAAHAFRWQDGVITDLGLLPGGTNSQVNWISASGLMTGLADNGQADPLIGNPFQIRGAFWGHDGVITDIGALPGTYFANPFAVNDRGEVVGVAMNTIPDANSLWQIGYQTRAFYWKDGVMQDLGTLGTGTDALAGLINQQGQVVGWSYTNAIPTAACTNMLYSFTFPVTTGSFIWDKHHGMRDLGGLGGTCTLAGDINNRGQIVGASSLAGDQNYHPFVWDAATGMTDLMGTSNGAGFAHAINDRGQIVGVACDAVGECHAALWQKSGGKWRETNLGILAVGNCPNPTSVNASAQVVGVDYCNLISFLSEDGAPIVALNTLVPSNSSLQLGEVGQINDRGEISINAADANGNNHAVLLVPCDENHPDVSGCDYDLIDAETAAARSNQNATQPPAALPPGNRMPGMMSRFRFPKGRPVPGHGAMPAPTASLAVPRNPATTDWLADRLPMPEFQQPTAFCAINNGVLTGRCVAVSATFACSVLPNVCPQGESATSRGTTDCNGSAIAVSTTKCDSAGFSLSNSSALTPGTITPGVSSSATLSVTAFGGFSGSVAFTCAVQPSPMLAPTCAINPSSASPGTPATLTVSTTAPTSALLSGAGSGLRYAFWLPLFGLALTGAGFGSKQKSRKANLIGAALIWMLFAGLVLQLACGGSPKPGTPAGQYIITVTGTDSTGTLVNSLTFAPLSVQ